MHGAGRKLKLSDLWRDAEADPTHSRNINYEGVRTIIEAAQASGTCGRVVRITGKGEARHANACVRIETRHPGPHPTLCPALCPALSFC